VSTADLVPRRAEKLISAALEDTRVVLISGARQSGKSTLVRLAAGRRSAERRDLDRRPRRTPPGSSPPTA
jgi:predicted AAA+ superfamily ATPase